MAKLYIIGNGFDLWHGLPTGYDRFYVFAKEMLDELENYYSFDVAHVGLWCDFENSLGRFDWRSFYEAHDNTDVTAESFSRSKVYGLEDDLTEQADHLVEAIRESFREWIEGIDISVAEKKLAFPEDAGFITFNYTSTLQSIYGISDEKVFHVHGRADKFDALIFGHGETMDEEPELDENGDSNRTMFSDAEGAAKYPFYALRKPVGEVIEKNRNLFDSVGHISEIIVVGHSLNTIDLPYFSKLAACAPNAQWLVCCYDVADEVHHVEELVNCDVRRESIRTCTYADLQDEHHYGRT